MIDAEQIEQIKELCPGAKQFTEAGLDYILLPDLQMPEGCNPQNLTCLLCTGPRDGYQTRLLFSKQVSSREPRNWNGQNLRVCEQNWFSYSWQVPAGMRAIEILINHLGALR